MWRRPAKENSYYLPDYSISLKALFNNNPFLGWPTSGRKFAQNNMDLWSNFTEPITTSQFWWKSSKFPSQKLGIHGKTLVIDGHWWSFVGISFEGPGNVLLASCPWGPITANGVDLLTQMYVIYMKRKTLHRANGDCDFFFQIWYLTSYTGNVPILGNLSREAPLSFYIFWQVAKTIWWFF